MIVGINCGHTVSGTVGAGAVGYLNESNETRAVGYLLIKMLKLQGHTVIDCTNDNANTVSDNLAQICALANKQPLDMFLSIHFNAGGGEGTEAYTYGGVNAAGAGAMTSALQELGFRNRGIKDGSNLYVIRNTTAPACLLEVCFVDTKSDADLYRNLGAERVAAAICKAMTGTAPTEEGGLTLSQYDELNDRIADLTQEMVNLRDEINRLNNPMIYNYIDDNMPEWARPTVQKLVDKGILLGDENGLNLTDEMLRLLVLNDRAGLYE